VDLPGLWMSLYLRHPLAPEKLRESGETSGRDEMRGTTDLHKRGYPRTRRPGMAR
jgi:hypothetical protein